jgi:NAD(P)-dependent dehydrogenase (short-subunit alcohol dehydrogenase family)
VSGDDPVCIVTGGAGAGIGSGISRVLAADGWQVVIADLDRDAGEALAAELPSASFSALDVRDLGAMEDVVARVAADRGPPLGLVNSAGVGAIGRACEIGEDVFDRILDVDLRGAWRMMRLAIPHMIAAGGGSIVNIGSVHAGATHPGWAVYGAAKAALEALTRGVAADYGAQGVRCNIVHPGLVDSAQNRSGFAAFGDPEEFMHDFIDRAQLLPHLLEPHDIGDAVSFLLGPRARGISGTSLVVDAGNRALLFDKDPRILAMLDRDGRSS